MREDLLHFIWKLRLTDPRQMQTTNGEIIQILKPGIHNHNAGPDFFDARIRIGNTLWAGNVEIHVKSSEWTAHNHQNDKAYNNVILHVVYQHDRDIYLPGQRNPIPVLELKPIISDSLIERYQVLQNNSHWVPCSYQLKSVPSFTKKMCLERMLIERLESKSRSIFHLLKENKGDWQNSFYVGLARSFGFNVNNLPFEQLAQNLPPSILSRHKNNRLQIEALLFGQAGFMPGAVYKETYPNQLAQEFSFLKKKHNLTPMQPEQWKFLRTRPVNFPTIRLSQFAHLILKSSHLFSKILENTNYKDLRALFECEAHEYWKSHFKFDKESSSPKRKKLGEKSIDGLLINTVIPFIFAYGKQNNSDLLKSRAMRLLGNLPPENNRITRKWQEYDMYNSDASNSQALIHLKKHFCNEKRCLECSIGSHIMQKL